MKTKLKQLFPYLLAFLLPIILYWITCKLLSIYPFGNVSNLKDDLYIQYTDYFSFYKNVLLGKDSLIYTFTKSLGGSVISLWGYYLASPFSLLVIFFKPENIADFIFVITSLKLAFCGLAMYFFVKVKFKSLPLYALLMLSTAYAFTQFTVGQMANINWLDGVYMLPFMLIGVEFYLNYKKAAMLYLSTAISVLFNWYTGYMNCLFIFIYFLYEKYLILKTNNNFSFKKYFKDIIRFSILEILSVTLSFVVILPVFIAQSGGRSSFDDGIFTFATNGSFLDILRGFVIGSFQPGKEITLYCSTLFLLIVLYYFRNKNVKTIQKIASSILLAIMVFSLFFLPLESIWCGFKMIGSYSYRFLYIPIFTMLLIAGKGMESMKYLDKKLLLQNSIGIILTFLLLDAIKPIKVTNLWFSIILIVVFNFLLIILFQNKRYKKIALITCGIVFLGDLIMNGRWLMGYSYLEDATTTKEYISKETKLIEQVTSNDNHSFYRMDKTLNKDLNIEHNSFFANESMAYGYNGIQHYSSSYNQNTADTITALGYSGGNFPTFFHAPIYSGSVVKTKI